LLRDLEITWPDQVWATDITYMPMRDGFVYLVAIMDWFGRHGVHGPAAGVRRGGQHGRPQPGGR